MLDREVKRLVAELRSTGEWKNTVLMFTSDNGYFLGEQHIRQGKVFHFGNLVQRFLGFTGQVGGVKFKQHRAALIN